MADTDGPEHDRAAADYGEAQTRFEQLGGYALEAEAHRVLAGLGFDRRGPRPPGRASCPAAGGCGSRWPGCCSPSPTCCSSTSPPTTSTSTAWRGWSSTCVDYRGALLFVSHDRDFIDSVANQVIELAGGRSAEYVGGFAEFVVAAGGAARRSSRRPPPARPGRSRHAERFIERFRYKATKARQVQSRVKALEKLERIEVPDRKELVARFAFPEPPPLVPGRGRAGRTSTVGYDDEAVLTDVDLVVERGRKHRRWSGPTAPARPRCCACCWAS